MSETVEQIPVVVAEPAGQPPKPGADVIREQPGTTYKREATFDAAAIDNEGRKAQLSFSSELPVNRGAYMEVLSHDPADMDLSRLNDAHPLLLNHDPERQIGVIESAAIGADKKGRATVRFSKSQLGDEIWRDVKDGIRRLVSVGYRHVKELASEVRDGVETVRFAWQPYEVSIVSVPADSTVGIGRAEQTSTPKNFMADEIKINETEVRDAAMKEANKRVTEIMAIARNLAGKVTDVEKLRDAAIEKGDSVESFRAACLERLPTVTPQTNPTREIKDKDWQKYSLSRVISLLATNKPVDGFEKEVSDEIALKTGKRASGFWLPDEALGRNYVAGTGTLGGMLVQTSNLGDQFVELLRNKAMVMALGARTLNLSGPVTVPRHNAGGATNWVGESVASTLATGNFTQFTLTPQAVSAFQQYSKQLLMESNPSIDAIIRDDIVQQIALAIDLAALHGTGSGQPTGIANTTGINTVALNSNGLALGNSTAYPFMVSLETEVATDNADMGSLAYLMRPGHRGALKTQSRFSSTDTPVWEPNGTVNGYRSEVTNQIATNLTTGSATTICSAIFFGNWNDLIIANFGSTDLVVDPYVLAVNGVVRVIARRWADIGVRHPVSFCVGGGVLTT